ncbi:hypothetical protein [Polaromonas sp. YR568]|uniref:hypothetical protein n=1 Tax=Polaromonas sp. YR568 TaxID=1855301 RepID=UPI00398BCD9A
MLAAQFVEKSRDPEAWRKHARALRRSADVLWKEFERALLDGAVSSFESKSERNLDEALELFETTKLLYGLTLETALKAWIVEYFPSKIEIRVAMDGKGEATQAELRAVGVPTSSGHNLLALAEAAGLFGEKFESIMGSEGDRRAMRNICRDLGEVVLWRGRYPVPLASFEPLKLDSNVPNVAVAHYIRDWLDPVLDALLECPRSQE